MNNNRPCPNCNRIFDKRKQCKSIEEYRNLLTEIAIRFVEDRMWDNKSYGNRNYYVCSRECEDSLVESRDYYYDFQEAIEREMCGDI